MREAGWVHEKSRNETRFETSRLTCEKGSRP
jgi:hypothetical protein